MSARQRLPFDERVDDPPGIRLQTRDVEVVKAVYEYRFLLRDQIVQLLFPSVRTANRRLKLLFQHGYLQRLFLSDGTPLGEQRAQAIYALDEKGANLLAAEYGIDRGEIDWYSHRNQVGEHFIQHHLRINDFRIAITLAAEERGDQVLGWIPERKLREDPERVRDPKTDKKHPVIPDAYFVYELGETGLRAHFFLEIDMATMSNPRFAEKVERYLLYRQGRYFEERYEGRSFRVLVVTTSQRRLRNLKQTTEQAGGKSTFWFATFEGLDSGKILGDIWKMASQTGQYSLLGGQGG